MNLKEIKILMKNHLVHNYSNIYQEDIIRVCRVISEKENDKFKEKLIEFKKYLIDEGMGTNIKMKFEEIFKKF